MKKRSYLAMCLIMAMLCACLVTVPTVMVGAEKSPFDIDFDDMSVGAYDASGESGAIQYWASNISSANPQVVAENGNNFLRIDGSNETQKGVGAYMINWGDDIDHTFSETSFRFRMSDMTTSGTGIMKPYFKIGFGYRDLDTDTGHKWPTIFAISDDGKSILALNDLNATYQNGTQVNYFQPLYTSETSLENMWLDVKIKFNFTTGALKCIITDENGKILTSFAQIIDGMKNKRLYAVNWSTNFNINETDYRRMKLDFDDIAYKGYDQVPNPFDLDFEDLLTGAFDASGESEAVGYFAKNISSASPQVVAENGNNFLRIDGSNTTQKAVGAYFVNWLANIDHTYSETMFRFRMSDMSTSGTGIMKPYFKVGFGHRELEADAGHAGPSIFAISDDGKSILALSETGTTQNGTQFSYFQPLYTSETLLEDMWLTVKIRFNFERDELKCTITDENGTVLANFVQAIPDKRRLYNVNFSTNFNINDTDYRRMKLDIDDIAYKSYTYDQFWSNPFDIDFEEQVVGAFDAAGESDAIKSWVNNGAIGSIAKTIKKEESGNHYLSFDGTDEALTSGSLLYLVNWSGNYTKNDKFSKTSFRFRMSDMAKSEDTTGQPYFYVTAGYYDGNKLSSPKIFAISDDGKSILAFDDSNSTYHKGQKVNWMEPLYTSETSLADQWLTVNLVNDFETGEMTCTIYGENGAILTKFVEKLGSVMTGHYLYCISPYMNITNSGNTYRRKMTLDLDDISYQAYTSLPEVETYDVTVSYDENQGAIVCDGATVNGKLTVEKGETVTLKITPADAYEIDTITVNNAAYTATDNAITLENISEAQTVKVTFKEKIVTPAITTSGADYLISGNYTKDEKIYPSVTAFYKMTLPKNADLKEYGMYFGDGTDFVRLTAQGKTTDHVFGIRVFGAAVEKGSTYTFKGFLQMNGEEEISGSEGTYTIEE